MPKVENISLKEYEGLDSWAEARINEGRAVVVTEWENLAYGYFNAKLWLVDDEPLFAFRKDFLNKTKGVEFTSVYDVTCTKRHAEELAREKILDFDREPPAVDGEFYCLIA